MNFKNFSEHCLPLIDEALKEVVANTQALDEGFIREMFEYHLGWRGENAGMARGKQIRPLMVMLCGLNEGADERVLLPAGAAVELLHNFSLIHDDIQDNSAMRRGRETVWVKWGVAQAINTGDAMFTLSYEAMMRLLKLGVDPDVVAKCVGVLTETNLMLTKGQHLDIAFENEVSVSVARYEEMVEGKTGALVKAACSLGAILAGADDAQVGRYAAFGRAVGIAFQLRDDYLGIWGDDEKVGKSVRSDFLERKKTYPILFALEKSDAFGAMWAAERFSEEGMQLMEDEMVACGAKEAVMAAFETHESEAVRILNEIGTKEVYEKVFVELLEMLSMREH